MNSININRFTLNINRLGHFRRDNGDIWWAGIQENENLLNLYTELCNQLIKYGFKISEQKFTPHLTLARQVILKEEHNNFFNNKLNVNFEVNTIYLMRSDRISGRLTYTSVFKKQLN